MISEQVSILVVENDPIDRELMIERLKGDDFVTTCARDGHVAWELLRQEPDRYDVVIVSRIMPRMDGLALLRRIKAHKGLTHIPVIMATSAAQDHDIVEGISAGAFYFLTKPVDHIMLVSMVRAAASDRERYRELQRELRKDAGMLRLMKHGLFEIRTPDEANDLGTFLAKAYPDPERVVTGLGELLVNAVEHGNLEITYEQKSRLIRSRQWRSEIERRLESAELGSRVATAELERLETSIRVTITDQGQGFDPVPYLVIDPSRVFDSHGRGIALANLVSFDQLSFFNDGRKVVAVVDHSPGEAAPATAAPRERAQTSEQTR